MHNKLLTFLIDDDEVFVFATKRLIQLKNFCKDVYHFSTVAEAITYFINHKKNPDLIPDVVFIDINLQTETGWEFIDHYEELCPELVKESHIYMLSASLSHTDLEKATQYPSIKGFLEKPLSKENLAQIFAS
jgi:DNA-binding NarL/FixJ family response regulator